MSLIYSTKPVAMTHEREDHGREIISEIPFVKENGVCKVLCKINGLPLHFVFDTGAADVAIVGGSQFYDKKWVLDSK